MEQNLSVTSTDTLFVYLRLIVQELQSRMISLEDYLYSP